MGLGSSLKKIGKSIASGFSGGGLTGGLIGAGASILGDILGNEAAEDAQRRQQEFDLKMWHLQNEYNTPANQVARWRAAGLNPNLIYGQGTPGNATNHPTTKAVQYSYDFARAYDKIALYEQMRNMREQNKNLQEQNKNIAANTRKANIDADVAKLQLDYFEKYGRFPNQSVASAFTQGIQDLTGVSSHSLEWLRETVVNEIHSIWQDFVDRAQEADAKYRRGVKIKSMSDSGGGAR